MKEIMSNTEEMDVLLGISDDEFSEMMQQNIKDIKLPAVTGSVSVGVDIGNITTVAVSGKNEIIIESRVGDYTEFDKLSGAKTIELLNETYVIEKGEFENKSIKHEKEIKY